MRETPFNLLAWLRYRFSSKAILLPSDDDGGNLALIPYTTNESKELLLQIRDETIRNAHRIIGQQLSPTIVDQMVKAVPGVAERLSSGKLYQIVSSPGIKKGLESGGLKLMKAGKDAIYSPVVTQASGKIRGHVSFKQLSSLKKFASPAVAFQALNAIAGTMELASINEKLDSLQHALDRLQKHIEAQELGEILNAISTLNEISNQAQITGSFNRDMTTRLAHAEATIGGRLQGYRILVEQARSDIEGIIGSGGKQGAAEAEKFLTHDGEKALKDMRLMVALIQSDIRLRTVRMKVHMEHAPEYLASYMEATAQRIAQYSDDLQLMPNVADVQRHAKSCISEMGWWSRFWNRKLIKKVNAADHFDSSDLSIEMALNPEQQDRISSYVFWEEKDGTRKVYQLSTASADVQNEDEEAEDTSQEADGE